MTDPKPKRLTSAELIRLADGTVAAVKKLALHLAAVEAEREASETGHHNLAAHTESGLRTERDHLRTCLDQMEGALAAAESSHWRFEIEGRRAPSDSADGRTDIRIPEHIARIAQLEAEVVSARDLALEDAAKVLYAIAETMRDGERLTREDEWNDEAARTLFATEANIYERASARIRALKGGAK